SSPGLVDLMRRASAHARRVGSICTGAFVLAETGLLDGKRVTNHWQFARDLQRAYPKLRVEEDRIFINEGKFWTSNVMTAYVDLCLAIVEADHGEDVARHVARRLVVHHRRSGGQTQFAALLE